jgi:hypothetical protein
MPTLSRLSVIGLVVLLAGCTSAIKLRHPVTGQEAKCGPYHVGPLSFGDTYALAAERERRCLDDYQRQGDVRVPD